MRFPRRPMVLGLALATGLAGLGAVATHAGASDPPLVLSPTTGPAGTSITVTLPSACKVPKKPAGTSGQVSLSFSPVAGGTGYAFKTYPVNPGQRVRVVTFLAPSDARSGHDTLTGECFIMKPKGFTFTTYGAAFFDVTGGKGLPKMKVTPTSGAAGSVVTVTAKCAPTKPQPTAVLEAVLSSATDPNTNVSNQVSGVGPKQHVSITIPNTFAPGSYFVAAACFDYANQKTYAEQAFTVTVTKPARGVVGGNVVHR